MESILQMLLHELRQSTRASLADCEAVAGRLVAEVERICQNSQRIQSSEEVQVWFASLTWHRLKQCMNYYQLGSKRGRLELHSVLSTLVYAHLPHLSRPSFRSRMAQIDQFLPQFYQETLDALRRENSLSDPYAPRTALELAEYMAFSERYAKRRIPLPDRRSEMLIVLRVQSFAQQHNPIGPDPTPPEPQTPAERLAQQKWVKTLMAYLEEQNAYDCASYFALRLKKISMPEIEEILGLTPPQRQAVQQRFAYYWMQFVQPQTQQEGDRPA